MDPMDLQKLLPSCFNRNFPIVQLENLCDLEHLKDINIVKSSAEEVAVEFRQLGTCDLCSISGKMRETDLEHGLCQSLLSSSYKSARITLLCESCSNVIQKVRKLQDRSLRINEDLEDAAVVINTVSRIREKYAPKPKKIKSEVKEEHQTTLLEEEDPMDFQKFEIQSNLEFDAESKETEHLDPNCRIPAESDKENKFLCSIPNCRRIYPQLFDLWMHQKRIHGMKRDGTFSCYFCGHKLSKRGSLYEHLLEQHIMELPETCSVKRCRFKAGGRTAWRNHLKTKHPKEWKKWDRERLKPKMYKCTHCLVVFSKYPDYWRHYRRHKTHHKNHVCETCYKGFSKWIYLQNHINFQHKTPRKVFKCPYPECKAPPPKSKSDLTQHIRIRHTVENAICEYCGGKYNNRFLLKHHQRNSKTCAQISGRATDLYCCSSCPKSYMTGAKLRRHVKKMHNPNRRYKFEGTETGVKCYFCKYVVQKKRLYSLYEHMSLQHLGELPLACEVKGCSYRTAAMGYWLGHMRRNHKAEMKTFEVQQKSTKFKCSHCPKDCKNVASLLAHEKTHGRPRKTFQCQQCDRSFLKKVSLQEHLIYRHGNGGTTYSCPHQSCKSFPFASKSRLNLHIKVSHIQEEAKCGDCRKAFKNSASLREHQRRNRTCAKAAGRTLPLPCTFPKCTLSFSKKAELQRHVAFVHLPRYKCKQCDASFVLPNEREDHMLSEHGGVPCNLCLKLFENSISYQKHHSRVHLESKEKRKYKCMRHKVHTCYFCDAKFGGNHSLENHLIKVHLNK